MKKQTKRTNNQKNAKHSKSGLIAFVANNFKYILATIAIIIAIIAVFFGESKLIFSDTKSANVNFNILYYRNVQTEERFLTLADAVANAESLQNSGVYATNTIQVINGGTETTAVTIPAGKNIVLDLNGKDITLNNVSITNNGTLTITGDSGKITGGTADTIINNGTFTKNGESNIESTSTDGSVAIPFRNNEGATATLNGGTIAYTNETITADRFAIVNDGTLTIDGATVDSTVANSTHEGGIHNKADTAKLIISSGTVQASATTIYNESKVNTSNAVCSVRITGGTIKSVNWVAIVNNDEGRIYIEGEETEIESENRSGISMTASSGGEIEVSGGTITSKGLGSSAVAIVSGTTVINNGTLIGTQGFGASVDGTATLTVGDQTNAVNTTTPRIIGKNNSGVFVKSASATFNFYDGIIIGPTGQSISGTVADKPEGYSVVNGTETISGTTYETATLDNHYTVSYDTMNLLYGLNDCGETLGPNGAFSAPSYFMKYSISDKVVTATALQNDGYGMTSGRVDLEANREYVFSCTTNGTLGHSDSEDTIEIYLCKDGLIDTYYRMDTNNNFKFTPTVSGTYWLRLDVNQNGKTHTFSNITVTYADEANKEYGTAYGTLPNPSIEGYTFNGWYANAVKATTLIDNYEVKGESIGYNASYIVSEMIPIEGGTTLYSNIPICGIYTYDINKTRINRESNRVTTHPISSNAKYIRIEICKTDDNQTLSYYQDNLVISDYQHLADITYKNDQITSSTTNTIPSDHTLFAKYTPNQYTVSFDENINYFNQMENTLTGFTGASNYYKKIGEIDISNISLNDTVTFEADVSYENLTANTENNYFIIFQNYGYATMWSEAYYNSSFYKFLGTGTAKVKWSWTFDNSRFNENDFYACLLRTDYYTGGTITLSNIKVTKQNSTKQVTYGEAYGTLPTLTRTGYTFNGWNGKNLFNKDTISSGNEISGNNIIESNNWFVSDYIEVEPGQTYTISGRTQGIAILYYDENKENPTRIQDCGIGTITIPNGKHYIRTNSLISEKDNLQIEKGSTATAYEPYYVTSSTTVMQAQNHTLKAIYTPNQYTVTFDENINVFTQTNNTLTNFSGATRYSLQLGSMNISDVQLNDVYYFEADLNYENLTANTAQNYYMIFQNYGNVTTWSAAAWNGPQYKLLGTGTQKVKWTWQFNNSRFSENSFYRFQLRTDYYTGGTITLSNIKVTKQSATQTMTYDTPANLRANTFTKQGYKFAGWSTSATDTNVICEDTEYYKQSTVASNAYENIKQWVVTSSFAEGDVYQLDVDIKGTGTLVNYFYYNEGTGKKVAKWESPTTLSSGTEVDGRNYIPLTSDWSHYTVRFTMTSNGNAAITKYLLFRVFGGNTAYFKNIRFNKVSSTSTAYVDQQTVKNLAISGNVDLYALWKEANYGEYNSSGEWQTGYDTLADAFTGVTNGNTIKPLTDTTEPAVTQSKGTTAAPVTLDLNGHTITMSGAITNSGTLTVNGTGTLTNSANINTIVNNGTLTASGSSVINGTGPTYTTVVNNGTFTVNGATISATSFKGIYNGYQNQSGAKLIILDGTVSAPQQAIDNYGTSITNNNESVQISGGTITSSSNNTIVNNSTGAVKVSGGTVQNTGAFYAVNNASGKVIINGGTVESKGSVSLYNKANVQVLSGTIKQTGSNSAVRNDTGGTIEMSGGTITSSGATGISNGNTSRK